MEEHRDELRQKIEEIDQGSEKSRISAIVTTGGSRVFLSKT